MRDLPYTYICIMQHNELILLTVECNEKYLVAKLLQNEFVVAVIGLYLFAKRKLRRKLINNKQ